MMERLPTRSDKCPVASTTAMPASATTTKYRVTCVSEAPTSSRANKDNTLNDENDANELSSTNETSGRYAAELRQPLAKRPSRTVSGRTLSSTTLTTQSCTRIIPLSSPPRSAHART
jgi:hypothetical protein